MEPHPPRNSSASDSLAPTVLRRSSVPLTIVAIAIGVALALLVADQASKGYIVDNYQPNEWIAGSPYLSLVFVTNVGGVCGYAQGAGTLLTAVGVVTSALIIVFLFVAMPASPVYGVAFGMLLAGALGNLVDRLRFGYVVDFITLDFLRWPSFNIADSSIIGGIALIGFLTIWEMIQEERHTATGDTSSQLPAGGSRVLGLNLGWSTIVFLVVAGITFAVAYWFCVFRPFD
jgi:signal peptidase II